MLKVTSLIVSALVLATSAYSQEGRMPNNEMRLNARSAQGYPRMRSSIYNGYMDPYLYSVGAKAMVELRSLAEDGGTKEGPRGTLTLEQTPNGVRIYGSISGLAPGLHGFHIHEKGDLSKGCISAGPHFNPYLANHGAPNDPERHVGDLGNIQAGEDGVAQVDGVDQLIALTGMRGIVGRSVVVHEKQDDLGRGGTEESAKTGTAGSRVACGIIGFI